MDDDRRSKMLDEAEELLRNAADLIRESVKGTEYEVCARQTLDSISDMIGSKENGGSIANLRKDLLHGMSEQPIWTRPLVSVKNINRRDI